MWEKEKEPFYKWYLKQHSFRGRFRLRKNWFLNDLRCLMTTIKNKFKYGFSYGEAGIEDVSEK